LDTDDLKLASGLAARFDVIIFGVGDGGVDVEADMNVLISSLEFVVDVERTLKSLDD
jgi:hypothetical protein